MNDSQLSPGDIGAPPKIVILLVVGRTHVGVVRAGDRFAGSFLHVRLDPDVLPLRAMTVAGAIEAQQPRAVIIIAEGGFALPPPILAAVEAASERLRIPVIPLPERAWIERAATEHRGDAAV